MNSESSPRWICPFSYPENWTPKVLTPEEVRALLEEGRKLREEMSERIREMRFPTIEELLTKAR